VKRKKTKKTKKIYSKKYLSGKTLRELRVFCSRKDIPWLGLKKNEVIENITAWQLDNKIPYEGKIGIYEEGVGKNRKNVVTHRMRKFAFEYAMNTIPRSREEWAKDFQVSVNTINNWMSNPNVKKMIEIFVSDQEQVRMEYFNSHQVEVLEELMRVITARKISETKRKAINDFLGFAGAQNVNIPKINIKQGQAQGQKSINFVRTEEEIDNELKELEELMEDN